MKRIRVRAVAGMSAIGLAVVLGGCVDSGHGEGADDGGSTAAGVGTFPGGSGFDYQLGGAYRPPRGTTMVVRDRAEAPEDGAYSICYVNAFQTQPGQSRKWPGAALLSEAGQAVTDPDWPDETLLDTSTPNKRSVIAGALAPQIKGCAKDGFDAVELDNLDSFTRSKGLLSLSDNAALAKDLVKVAHEQGLAVGQKNLAEHAQMLRKHARFDFAVAEECAAHRECGQYSQAYGEAVLDIEYTDNLPRTFAAMCTDGDTPPATILRDRDLVTQGKSGYVYDSCP